MLGAPPSPSLPSLSPPVSRSAPPRSTEGTLLITGGCGYIGSHTVQVLLDAGYTRLVVLDTLANASPASLYRIEQAAGIPIPLVVGDVGDEPLLRDLFRRYGPITGVFHFAGRKSVAESVRQEAAYWRDNVVATATLIRVMNDEGCRTIVFSSSAVVYGAAAPDFPHAPPAVIQAAYAAKRETDPFYPTNPYAWTKLACEELLRDAAAAAPWRVALLRYFNPVGAHPSGLIGEDPVNQATNLMPIVANVAARHLGLLAARDASAADPPVLPVFGTDYSTPDGTAVRDFIHVMDLARGHVDAYDALMAPTATSTDPAIDASTALAAGRAAPATGSVVQTFNLGLGRGASVLEVVRAFESVVQAWQAEQRLAGHDAAPSPSSAPPFRLPICKRPRRVGDVGLVVADNRRARTWLPRWWRGDDMLDLHAMCADVWRWTVHCATMGQPSQHLRQLVLRQARRDEPVCSCPRGAFAAADPAPAPQLAMPLPVILPPRPRLCSLPVASADADAKAATSDEAVAMDGELDLGAHGVRVDAGADTPTRDLLRSAFAQWHAQQDTLDEAAMAHRPASALFDAAPSCCLDRHAAEPDHDEGSDDACSCTTASRPASACTPAASASASPLCFEAAAPVTATALAAQLASLSCVSLASSMFLGSTVYSDRDGSERSLDGDDETAHTPRTIGTGASTGAATPALLPPSTAASTAARPPAADGASEDPPPKLAYALGRDAALSRYASPSPPPLAASAAGAEGVAPSARTSAQAAAAARASLPRVDSGFSSGDAASASSRSPCWPIAVGKGGLAPGLKNPGMASPRPLYHMLTAVPICLVHGASPPAVPTVLPNSAALSSALSRTLA